MPDADDTPTHDAMANWSPPAVDAKTGVAQVGDFPANHRLRAEAMAAAGVTTDPLGMIGDDLIADTVTRLAGEAEAARLADQAKADETRDIKALAKADLIDFAGRQQPPIAIDPTANKDVIQDAVLAEIDARANPAATTTTTATGGTDDQEGDANV